MWVLHAKMLGFIEIAYVFNNYRVHINRGEANAAIEHSVYSQSKLNEVRDIIAEHLSYEL
jgi:hypothetical protein